MFPADIQTHRRVDGIRGGLRAATIPEKIRGLRSSLACCAGKKGAHTSTIMPEKQGTHRHRSLATSCALGGLLLLLSTIGWGLWRLTRDEEVVVRPSRHETPPPTAPVSEDFPIEPLIRPPAVAHDYVGSSACRECHRDVWDRYQSHPMAHSLQRVRDADPLEDYLTATEFSRSRRQYRIERTDDTVTHYERGVDADGEVIYDQGVAVHYAIGSGKRGRSYLIDRGGILFLSPISWYSQGNRWDLSPGYPEEGHMRFERRIVERCVMCHAGLAAPDPGWTDRFQQPAIIESSIGCENCHGPGRGHIAWQKAEDQSAERDPVVNPSRLDPARRDAVCNQCHLQSQAEILRYGRGNFDFRPGMNLGDVWSILVSDRPTSDGESTKAVSQVQQMLGSVCARQSGGRLGCTSCHDPHFTPQESERQAFYREKCLACHAVDACGESLERRISAPFADSCIACHMPRLSALDVPHTSQTDHGIPRHPGIQPRPHNNPQAGRTDDPQVIDAADAPLSKLEMSRVRGIVLAKLAEGKWSRPLAKGAKQSLESVFRAAPDDAETIDCLAVVRFIERQPLQALDLWRQLLTAPPIHEDALMSLTIALQNRDSNGEALEYLDRVLEVNPWHARYWNRRRQLLESLDRQPEALAAGLKALELDPSLAETYPPLVDLARRLGQGELAARLERSAQRLEPPQPVNKPDASHP
jgi:hypothetical protein